jgi:hypothetical protein
METTVFEEIANNHTKPALLMVRAHGFSPKVPGQLAANLGTLYLEGSDAELEELIALYPEYAMVGIGRGRGHRRGEEHRRPAHRPIHHSLAPAHHHADAGQYMNCSGCGGRCGGYSSADAGMDVTLPMPARQPAQAGMMPPPPSHHIMTTGLFIVAIFGLVALAAMKGEKHRDY